MVCVVVDVFGTIILSILFFTFALIFLTIVCGGKVNLFMKFLKWCFFLCLCMFDFMFDFVFLMCLF